MIKKLNLALWSVVFKYKKRNRTVDKHLLLTTHFNVSRLRSPYQEGWIITLRFTTKTHIVNMNAHILQLSMEGEAGHGACRASYRDDQSGS